MMRNGAFWSLLSLALLLFPLPAAPQLTPLPEESGWDATLSLGGGWLEVESNGFAGSDTADVGRETIDSLDASPRAEAAAALLTPFEIRRTFADSAVQLFLGNRLEDWLRWDSTWSLGARFQTAIGILAAAAIANPFPSEVWSDPFVVEEPRSATDRRYAGVEFAAGRIAGGPLELRASWRGIDLDDERSGRSQLGLGPAEASLLRRDGERWQLGILAPLPLGAGRHVLVPRLDWTRDDLDGAAVRSDRLTAALVHLWRTERFTLRSELEWGDVEYDVPNPVFDRVNGEDRLGVTLIGEWRRGSRGLSWALSAAWHESRARIDFYDARTRLLGLSAVYRF